MYKSSFFVLFLRAKHKMNKQKTCINIVFYLTKLKTALDWGPVGSAWNSLAVDGAMIQVILEKGNVWKDHQEDRWSLLACILMKWHLTLVFAQKRKTMSGLLSSVQVKSADLFYLPFLKLFFGSSIPELMIWNKSFFA